MVKILVFVLVYMPILSTQFKIDITPLLTTSAVVTMVIEEALTRRPVIQLTPWLFEPLILVPEVQRALDWEFAAAAFCPQ